MREFPLLITFADPFARTRLNRIFNYAKGNCEIKLFLDCGAFSEANKETKIDLYDYIQFVHDNYHRVEVYANLDNEDMIFNQKEMESAGLNPIPVVRFKAPMFYLQEVADKYSYVGIGGVGTTSPPDHMYFSRMAYETMRARREDIRIHGFGLAEEKKIDVLPYYSVDTTSWMCGRWGDLRLFHPEHKRIYAFQRCIWPTIAKNYSLLKETLAFYGATPTDFVKRGFPQKYIWAAIKSYLKYSEHKRSMGQDFTMYLSSVEPRFFANPEFYDYVFSDLRNDPTYHPLEGREDVAGRGRGTFKYRRKRYGAREADKKARVEIGIGERKDKNTKSPNRDNSSERLERERDDGRERGTSSR